MIDSINRVIREHPYLSIFFFVCSGVLFTLFTTLTGLGFIPAGFGIGSFLFGANVGAAIFDWTITCIMASAISFHFAALLTAVIDMIQTELTDGKNKQQNAFQPDEQELTSPQAKLVTKSKAPQDLAQSDKNLTTTKRAKQSQEKISKNSSAEAIVLAPVSTRSATTTTIGDPFGPLPSPK